MAARTRHRDDARAAAAPPDQEPASRPGSPARPKRGLGQAVAALKHRNFALFWAGALVSNVGTWMQNVTVPIVLLELTDDATWVGLSTFATLMPGVVVGPWGGALADRFQRRTVLLVANAVQVAVAVALWAAWGAGVRSPGVVLALVAAGGLCFGLSVASWQSFVSELVPREELLNAVTLNSAQFNGARAIGPAAAGAVLAAFGPSWAFLLNAASFLAVLASLALVRVAHLPRARSDRGAIAQFAEGLRYVRRSRGILVAIALVGLVGLVGSPVFSLAPVFAEREYGVGRGLTGVLSASYGVGAVLGAVALGALGGGLRRSSLVRLALAGFAAALVGLGLAPGYWSGLVALALCGASFLVVISSLNTTVQLQVDEEHRGRVMAVYFMAFTAGLPLGGLAQAWLAERVGAPATVVGAGAVLAGLAALLAARPRSLATLDATPSADPEQVGAAPRARVAASSARAPREAR